MIPKLDNCIFTENNFISIFCDLILSLPALTNLNLYTGSVLERTGTTVRFRFICNCLISIQKHLSINSSLLANYIKSGIVLRAPSSKHRYETTFKRPLILRHIKKSGWNRILIWVSLCDNSSNIV